MYDAVLQVAAEDCKECDDDPLEPVCGADSITYGNKCLAGCSKVKVVADGECPKGKVRLGPQQTGKEQKHSKLSMLFLRVPAERSPRPLSLVPQGGQSARFAAELGLARLHEPNPVTRTVYFSTSHVASITA